MEESDATYTRCPVVLGFAVLGNPPWLQTKVSSQVVSSLFWQGKGVMG
jgi:hypothetical protein